MLPFEILLLVTAFCTPASCLPPTLRFDHRSGRRKDSQQTVLGRDKHKLQDRPHKETHTYKCISAEETIDLPTIQRLSFDQLWRLNQPVILSSNGGDTYLEHYIHEAITTESLAVGMDPSLALALMMQQSDGRAATPCTAQARGGGRKCGLLQVVDGSSFEASDAQQSIARMIREGIVDDAAAGEDDEVVGLGARSDIANRLLGWEGRGEGYAGC
ncbi:hypothetical protein LTR62_003281 [Meristemomyces frigidus]|uniref:Uncharacterized protein n=1 Tax=Meristemomyces frigidus TaxID=1508187 RepID=A0AAN7TS46_9PEZI|nr:hypothetical protein LTR62_003281 [Meristemomyces frigidus]